MKPVTIYLLWDRHIRILVLVLAHKKERRKEVSRLRLRLKRFNDGTAISFGRRQRLPREPHSPLGYVH